ncbi:MAG: DUF4360 domain-containing protein [Thiobacillus sp.]|nr:DUF4360 domain-containing protein [Thiobacillus sp.]
MKPMMNCICASVFLAGLPAAAQAADGCPEGGYSTVVSPDGTTLSILFDRFTVASGDAGGGPRKTCRISAPLNLPANYSVGVYRVDYRGFAKLAAKQEAALGVHYFLGPHDSQHGREFKRKVKGPREDDFSFMEIIGAGQMKRVGCGADASLDVDITLGLDGDLRAGAAMASLDSTDAAPGGALVYHLDLRKCP